MKKAKLNNLTFYDKDGKKSKEIPNYIAYDDDIVLIADNPELAQEEMNKLNKAMNSYDMKINPNKSKWMQIGRNSNTNILIDDKIAEQVNMFKYLGYQLTNDLNQKTEIKMRFQTELK